MTPHRKKYLPTAAERAERERLVIETIRRERPTTIRSVKYATLGQFPGANPDPKIDGTYRAIMRIVGKLRADGRIGWGDVIDLHRRTIIPETARDLGGTLTELAEYYRRDPQTSWPQRVEVWAESDSVANVIEQVTMAAGVPLFPTKGMTGDGYTWAAAMDANRDGRPLHVLYIGDCNGPGSRIEETLRRKLARHLSVPMTFERVALNPEQIEGFVESSVINSLSLIPVEPTDAWPWPWSVETEALPSTTLRSIVSAALAGFEDDAVKAEVDRLTDIDRTALEILITDHLDDALAAAEERAR